MCLCARTAKNSYFGSNHEHARDKTKLAITTLAIPQIHSVNTKSAGSVAKLVRTVLFFEAVRKRTEAEAASRVCVPAGTLELLHSRPSIWRSAVLSSTSRHIDLCFSHLFTHSRSHGAAFWWFWVCMVIVYWFKSDFRQLVGHKNDKNNTKMLLFCGPQIPTASLQSFIASTMACSCP